MFILTLIRSCSDVRGDGACACARVRMRGEERKDGRVPRAYDFVCISYYFVKNIVNEPYCVFVCVSVPARAGARAATRASAFYTRCELMLGDIRRWPLICACCASVVSIKDVLFPLIKCTFAACRLGSSHPWSHHSSTIFSAIRLC